MKKREVGIKKKKKTERVLGIVALGLIVTIATLGHFRTEKKIEPFLIQLITEEQQFNDISENTFKVSSIENNTITGYISISTCNGYGGPMKMATLIDTTGKIMDFTIISHNETVWYVEKVFEQDFQRQIIDKTFQNNFQILKDIDAVAGATYTSECIAEAASKSCKSVALNQLQLEVPVIENIPFKFGFREVVLILLYLFSLIGIYRQKSYKKVLRWAIMLVSLFTLGFYFSTPLSMQKINSFLIGYWPKWQNDMYWFLLIIGGYLIFLVTNKRIYCNWICPFGAAQDCMGLISGKPKALKGKFKLYSKWFQRGLAFVAIVLSLNSQNPGKINYELFVTFFNLTGTTLFFGLTGIFILFSMFIKRPYCNLLCPITSIDEFPLMLKNWIASLKISQQARSKGTRHE